MPPCTCELQQSKEVPQSLFCFGFYQQIQSVSFQQITLNCIDPEMRNMSQQSVMAWYIFPVPFV